MSLYIMGFAHGAVVCSACALFGRWLAARPNTKEQEQGHEG